MEGVEGSSFIPVTNPTFRKDTGRWQKVSAWLHRVLPGQTLFWDESLRGFPKEVTIWIYLSKEDPPLLIWADKIHSVVNPSKTQGLGTSVLWYTKPHTQQVKVCRKECGIDIVAWLLEDSKYMHCKIFILPEGKYTTLGCRMLWVAIMKTVEQLFVTNVRFPVFLALASSSFYFVD